MCRRAALLAALSFLAACGAASAERGARRFVLVQDSKADWPSGEACTQRCARFLRQGEQASCTHAVFGSGLDQQLGERFALVCVVGTRAALGDEP